MKQGTEIIDEKEQMETRIMQIPRKWPNKNDLKSRKQKKNEMRSVSNPGG